MKSLKNLIEYATSRFKEQQEQLKKAKSKTP